MEHDAIWRMIGAQASNSQLSGRDLLAAAAQLVAICEGTNSTLFAFDAAGERIIGAALTRSDHLELFDVTRSFPPSSECVLVGGYIAGPAGIDAAATTVMGAGASHVSVAMLSEWVAPMPNVRVVHNLSVAQHVRVA